MTCRVLVCGGRDFSDQKMMNRVLTELYEERGIALIIHGGASGADRMSESWAFHRKIPVCVFPANWRFEGKAAGPIRNSRMLQFMIPDFVVAFPGGRGTEDMIRKAEASGATVVRAA